MSFSTLTFFRIHLMDFRWQEAGGGEGATSGGGGGDEVQDGHGQA